ncbi:MAG TPA: amidohydrolase [Pseudolysinimonas sp.]|nr:amidohydrolase [Pseudolysinimonas sp.]
MGEREAAVSGFIDAIAPRIEALATEIGAHPEIGYQEELAVAAIGRMLADAGHEAAVGVAGMATGLRVESGSSGPRVAVLAEYDALPEIGHACGHNVIGAAAVGAFLALAHADPDGRYLLLGCPAEESSVNGAGGKIRLIEAGEFDDVAAALMIHPYDASTIVTEGALAARGVEFVFRGRGAHAAMTPHEGINALDAVVQCYTAIAQLRQQLRPETRVHGIISDGGASPNVIPDRAALRMRLRAPTLGELEHTFDRVRACAEGAALATGCSLEVDEFMPPYAEMRQDRALADIGRAVLADLGVQPPVDPRSAVFGSSDFGNVSHLVPALEIGIQVAEEGIKPHTIGFAHAACSPRGSRAAVLGARAIAMTALRYRSAAA